MNIKRTTVTKHPSPPRRSVYGNDRFKIKVSADSPLREESELNRQNSRSIDIGIGGSGTPKAKSGPLESMVKGAGSPKAFQSKHQRGSLLRLPANLTNDTLKKSPSSNLQSSALLSRITDQLVVEHKLHHMGDSFKVKTLDRQNSKGGSLDRFHHNSSLSSSAAKDSKKAAVPISLANIAKETDTHPTMDSTDKDISRIPRKKSEEFSSGPVNLQSQSQQLYMSTPALNTAISSPLPLPRKKFFNNESAKYNFKHEILSMDGFSPEFEKPNQDYSKVYQFVSNKETTKLFLLADGHGPIGHIASVSAIDLIISFIEKKISEKVESELTDEFVKQILTDSFEHVQKNFAADKENNYRSSGTTMAVFMVEKTRYTWQVWATRELFLLRSVDPSLWQL